MATAEDEAVLTVRRVAALTAEVAQTLTRTQVAELLNVTPSRVSHRHTDGLLYAFRAGPARLLFPDWQFTPDGPLPHLAALIAVLDPSTPPSMIRRYMLDQDSDLSVKGTALAPREWLLAGGDPRPVLQGAPTLGDQI